MNRLTKKNQATGHQNGFEANALSSQEALESAVGQ